MIQTGLLERFAEGKVIYLFSFPLPDSQLRVYLAMDSVYIILPKMLYNG